MLRFVCMDCFDKNSFISTIFFSCQEKHHDVTLRQRFRAHFYSKKVLQLFVNVISPLIVATFRRREEGMWKIH